MVETLKEMEEILKDYQDKYFRILGNHGICVWLNIYAEKIERIEKLIEDYKK